MCDQHCFLYLKIQVVQKYVFSILKHTLFCHDINSLLKVKKDCKYGQQFFSPPRVARNPSYASDKWTKLL